jgi:hypothetical protein
MATAKCNSYPEKMAVILNEGRAAIKVKNLGIFQEKRRTTGCGGYAVIE